MNQQRIRLEKFSEIDFDLLIGWIHSEDELIQFAGTIFHFPLTKEQLKIYVNNPQRYVFRVIENHSNITIGHCEALQIDAQNVKICRVLIGEKMARGKGYGSELTTLLCQWIFSNLHSVTIELNVFQFNTAAIKAYEKVGFSVVATNATTTKILNKEHASFKMKITQEDFSKKNDNSKNG